MASERPSARIWTVTALLRELADTLDARFSGVIIAGEISGLTRAASGHCYFTLRDESAQLRCVMFRSRAMALDFIPRDGMAVEVRARLGVYEPRGDLQLQVDAMRVAGQGARLEQFMRLKARLQAEGLFEPARKRPLPAHPRTVGIITSLQAAALHDVLVTLRRRSPQLRVVLYPASVQGAQAPAELVRALQLAQARAEVDVLLLVRGGGSIEDLWAFNDEALARAIAASSLPVIAGVGHETDFTIADFAADLRAPTPTAAAELCGPARADLLQNVDQLARRQRAGVERMLAREQQRLDRIQLRLPTPSQSLRDQVRRLHALQGALQWRLRQRLQQLELKQQLLGQRLLRAPQLRLTAAVQPLHEACRRLPLALRTRLDAQARQLHALQQRLQLLNPAATLRRGYCLAWGEDGKLLTEPAALQPGQSLLLAGASSAVRLGIDRAATVAHPLAAMLQADSGESS